MLTPDQHATLRDLDRCLCRASKLSFELEALGLAQNGSGRFGSWARITEAGRQHLEKHPEAAPGPAEAGSPPRASTARKRRNVEPQAHPVPAGASSVTKPPADALDVGATSPKPRRRKSDGA